MSDSIKEITMPKWGLSMKEGKLLEWSVNEGDEISKGDEIADVETEKIASAVEAPASGKLRKIVTENDTVYPVGALLGVIADDSVSDDEVNAYVEKFLAEFVPPEDDDEEEVSASEFIDINGLNIRYVSKGEGDDTILLIHGFGGDLDNWLFNHDDLVARTGKKVIALDLPGHGQSSKSVGDGSQDFLADTVIAFMKAVGVDKAHLVGHSMGGAVALNIASKQADMVNSLSLICSAGLGKEINLEYLDGFIGSDSRKQIKPFLQQLFADVDLVTRQLINNMLQYKRLDGVTAALQQIKDGFIEGASQKKQFNDVLGSVSKASVIWGAKDQIIPASHKDNISGGNVEVLSVADAGHMVQMEAAKEVNEAIANTVA
jgi:pyruvate dehydrogenase E2 component (dihydrolipoamide acetyltransferase)